MNLLKRLFVEEEGQGLVEYALIIALIAVVAVAVLPGLQTTIQGIFTKVQTTVDDIFTAA